jgi:hypothetical protein
VTFTAPDPNGAQVFAALEVQLPMQSDEERGCAATALVADAELLARVRAGVAPNSPDMAALSTLVEQCRISTTAATRFANDFAADHPGTTPEQKQCLHDGFGALTPSDVDALLGAALSPPGSAPSPGVVILAKLLADCGTSQ